MTKKILLTLLMFFNISLFAQTDFPQDWNNSKVFSSINTKLSNIKQFPSCNKNFGGFPLLYQDLFNTYCKYGGEEGLGKIEILTDNKSVFFDKSLVTNSGVIILRIKKLKLLFVTQYIKGKPNYDVWTEDGKRASNDVKNDPLNPNTCMKCHNIYAEICENGVCGNMLKRRFQ